MPKREPFAIHDPDKVVLDLDLALALALAFGDVCLPMFDAANRVRHVPTGRLGLDRHNAQTMALPFTDGTAHRKRAQLERAHPGARGALHEGSDDDDRDCQRVRGHDSAGADVGLEVCRGAELGGVFGATPAPIQPGTPEGHALLPSCGRPSASGMRGLNTKILCKP